MVNGVLPPAVNPLAAFKPQGQSLAPGVGEAANGQETEEQRIARLRDECNARGAGWRWNAATNTCDRVEEPKEEGFQVDPAIAESAAGQVLLPRETTPLHESKLGQVIGTGQPLRDIQPAPEPPTIEDIYDRYEAEPGSKFAIPLPDGNMKDVTKEAFEQYKRELGTNIDPKRQFEQQQLGQVLEQIGQVGTLDPVMEAKINHSQAFMAGIANVIPSAIGGATLLGGAGLVGGGPIGGGAGAILGAIGGAITGITAGYISNVKAQQRGELGAAKEELTAAKSNMRQFAMLATQDPQRAEEYIELYNEQLTRAYQARRQVKAETSGDLNSWISDGRKELSEFDVFLQPGGRADLYGRRMQVALQSGVPLTIDDFEQAELKEMFSQ